MQVNTYLYTVRFSIIRRGFEVKIAKRHGLSHIVSRLHHITTHNTTTLCKHLRRDLHSTEIIQLTSIGLKNVTFKVIGPAGIVTIVRVGVILTAVAFVAFAAELVESEWSPSHR